MLSQNKPFAGGVIILPMTVPTQALHVYLRSINPNERSSLAVLAALVHPGATVLDLGCGSGSLGQHLREHAGCTIDGLTWSEEEAAHARPHYRRVIVADLEHCDLLSTFAGEHYDYIVCADVLEHLRRPETVLESCRQLLLPTGRLLVSVPNAGYAGLVAELLQGEFRYREEGLLDRTHLRFFTRRSLERFLSEQGWALTATDTIQRDLTESEFRTQFDLLPPTVARFLLAAPDALVYQFIGSAQPSAAPCPPDCPIHSNAPHLAQALFTAQVYADLGAGYLENGKCTATGVIGQERQTLGFALPTDDLPIGRLRLDPADRPGYLHLYAVRLLDNNRQILWQWQAVAPDHYSLLAQAKHHQIVWQAPLPGQMPTLLLLTGEDPWIELPISSSTLAHAQRLEVDVGWPMSADYLALSSTVQPLLEQVAKLQHDHSLTQEQLQSARTSLDQTRTQLEGTCATLTDALNATQNQNKDLRRHRHELTQAHARLQGDYEQLATHLHSIENSTIFRATRPLVHAKMRIDRLLGRKPTAIPTQPTPQPMKPTDQPVDIIVPVYRGLQDTQLCIQSVLAAPVKTPWRMVVINDHSPEPELSTWLRDIAAQDPRITLLENAENLGFVGTVNRGMALSKDHDVLLLNSDTEVANDWLDRMRAAAYSDARIASVTPFSTNATICSYPRFCKDNPLPAGWTTAGLDELCARTNPGVAVEVPTGVGFCMYIRRDCLREVGLFDVETFGKGYGEENDFCQRAIAKQWRNLHLLDTFVLHTGGVSFGDAKSPREQAAIALLDRLHPRYARDVHAFVQADPARPYRLALDVARIHQAQLPVVLAVLHDRAGGTLRHVQELALHLAKRAHFLTLTPASGESVALRMAGEDEGFELVFHLKGQLDDLIQVLQGLGVCHVHFHHLLGHSQPIYDLPAMLGVNHDFTAHDYFSFCTHISMTGNTGRYESEPHTGQCACCPPDATAPLLGTVAQWRSANAHLLTSARNVLAPSHDCAQRIGAFAPAARVVVAPHTDIAADTALPIPNPVKLAGERPLRIAVIGALSVIKGADVLEATAIEAAKRGAPLEFHLLGYGYRHLTTQPRACLTVHGRYEDGDLHSLLAWLQPDMVWFPAQWPETYSYTLSAALTAGLPVVVPNIGAFAERILGRPWSWILPWDQSPAQWVDSLTNIRSMNYANAQPPEPPLGAPAKAVNWSYERDYLTGLRPAQTENAATMLSAAHLAQFVRQPNATNAVKSGLLGALVWLRSLPLLRRMARAVPAQWQRRIKNRLQA